ncbi:MAG: hypothetical protein A2Y14_03490 [Verrucomicrobia bacterium GWF2_51_19]|nr:MAG: hypothetical protein A2Y14_03490 [Verrucomicrobia bacterium GWF2_51_19]HCJ12106.1 hypothetical protein [Opitutae bacterium]
MDLEIFKHQRHYNRDGRERLGAFLEFAGKPQCAYPVIQVTGTNGKGSVCALLELMLRTAGYRTGLYTNPSLIDEDEMYRINGKMRRFCQKDDVKEALTRDIQNFPVNTKAITFTDYFYLQAVYFFQQEAPDVAIFEANAGGYWDPGYTMEPFVSVVTSVGEDHFDTFGDSVEAVAFEKSAVIRPNRPLILGKMPPSCEAILRREAAAKGAPVFSIRERFGEDLNNYPQSVLPGDYHRLNAAIAILTLECIQDRFPVTQTAIQYGLDHVFWPARWQRFPLSNGRLLLVDFTHNPEGIRAIEPQLQALYEGRGPVICFLSIFYEYRARVMVPMLAKYSKAFVFVQSSAEHFMTFDEFKTFIPKDFRGTVTQSTVEAVFPGIHQCALGDANDTILLLGSPVGIIAPSVTRFFISVDDMQELAD